MNQAGPPEVTVLVPCWEAQATLEASLRATLGQRTTRAMEVVVVDDGSRDRSREVAREVIASLRSGLGPASPSEAARCGPGSALATPSARYPQVRLLEKENGGEASALNVGWRAARATRFVAIVEADVEPEPDWLERCLAVLEREPDAWGVGGYLETPPDDPWIARLAGWEVERKFRTKPRETRHLTSANVVYRREAFELAGPFDERLVNASLDSVFNGRLAKAGKRLVYEREARVRHHYKTSFLGYLRRQWAYARFRVHNEVLDLYPADRFLAAHVALAALALTGLALAPFFWLLPPPLAALVLLAGPALLALALLLQAPPAVGLLVERGDLAAFLWPPVVVLRNAVGAVGYAVGAVNKLLGRV